MEQSDNTTRREEDEAIASTRYPTSARLVAAIHRGDERAIREFFLLYAPLLRDQARRMSIGPDERDGFVTTLLDDVVLHLMERQIAPRSLSRYLVASLRNRARNWHRDTHRRLVARESAYGESNTSGQRIVAECHSEYSIRASGRDEGAGISTRPVIARLAARASGEHPPGSALSRNEYSMVSSARLRALMPSRAIAIKKPLTSCTTLGIVSD